MPDESSLNFSAIRAHGLSQGGLPDVAAPVEAEPVKIALADTVTDDEAANAQRRWANDSALLAMVCALDLICDKSFPTFLKDTFGREYIRIVFSLLSHPEGYPIEDAKQKIGKDCRKSAVIIEERIKELIEGEYVKIIKDPNDQRKSWYVVTPKTHKMISEGAFYAATWIAKFGPIIADRYGSVIPVHHPWEYKLPLSENPYKKHVSDPDGNEPAAAAKERRKQLGE